MGEHLFNLLRLLGMPFESVGHRSRQKLVSVYELFFGLFVFENIFIELLFFIRINYTYTEITGITYITGKTVIRREKMLTETVNGCENSLLFWYLVF
jgi:hypothetical protein